MCVCNLPAAQDAMQQHCRWRWFGIAPTEAHQSTLHNLIGLQGKRFGLQGDRFGLFSAILNSVGLLLRPAASQGRRPTKRGSGAVGDCLAVVVAAGTCVNTAVWAGAWDDATARPARLGLDACNRGTDAP